MYQPRCDYCVLGTSTVLCIPMRIHLQLNLRGLPLGLSAILNAYILFDSWSQPSAIDASPSISLASFHWAMQFDP